MLCQRAITLLREDSVAWLAGSLASSAWYVLRRNPPCLPSRSIVSQLRSSKESILHWTHDIVERVHLEAPSVTNTFAALGLLIFAAWRGVQTPPLTMSCRELLDSPAA